MRLQPVSDVDEYFRDPAGKVLNRRGYFCSSPDGKLLTLWGWGHVDIDSTEELLEIFAAVERARLPSRRQLVVLRHMQSVSPRAMTRFIRYHQDVTAYLRGIEREAVVRPDGLVGVMAEGFYRAVHHPGEGRVFTDLGNALAWLEVDAPEWVSAAVAHEERSMAAQDDALVQLDALWRSGWMRVGLEDAARSLGLSPRTLQRRLRDAGESFEERRAREALHHAEELLQRGLEVKAVASELGFASSSAFVAAFRRSRGLPPHAWREASR
jgi:AraC-like DNA-binding protein